jgi:TPR repeat protein
MGNLHDEGSPRENIPKHVKYHKQACSLGEPRACTSAAYVYHYGGKGVRKNRKMELSLLEKAKALYEKSCASGNKADCTEVERVTSDIKHYKVMLKYD